MTQPASISLAEQISGTTLSVLPHRYSVLAAASLDCLCETAAKKDCFAAIYDGGIEEYTLIIREDAAEKIRTAAEKPVHAGYRIIRFNLLAPFEGVGFIAALAQAVAAKNINILAVSAFPSDYILVKDSDLGQALAALAALGIPEQLCEKS